MSIILQTLNILAVNISRFTVHVDSKSDLELSRVARFPIFCHALLCNNNK